MMSSDGSEPLACFRITGWPTRGTPSSTASTTFGEAYVPSSRLKTEPHGEPHSGVAALDRRLSSATTPPTVASVARYDNDLPHTVIACSPRESPPYRRCRRHP